MKRLTEQHKKRIGDALRGKPKSEAHRAALKANHVGATGRKWTHSQAELMRAVHTGRKVSDESKKKMSLSKIGKPSKCRGRKFPERSGPNHHNWRGGITSENTKIRNSTQYREWRSKVFKRDGWTCVVCGHRSCGQASNGKSDIQADHIKPFADYPELRFDVSNGRTLCVPCHDLATEAAGLRKRRKPNLSKDTIQ